MPCRNAGPDSSPGSTPCYLVVLVQSLSALVLIGYNEDDQYSDTPFITVTYTFS